MQRLVLRSLLAAASALFLLQASACDKGGEKADAKKADDKKAPEPTPEPTPTPTPEPAAETTAAPEPAGTETGAAEAGAEAGAGETTGAAEPTPEPDAKVDPKPKTTDKKPDDTTAAAKIDGKPIFESKCKSCHGSDGKGDTTIGKKVDIPSLASTKISKAEAVKTITNGVADTKMKGYADKLSKDEIDAVAAYVKKL